MQRWVELRIVKLVHLVNLLVAGIWIVLVYLHNFLFSNIFWLVLIVSSLSFFRIESGNLTQVWIPMEFQKIDRTDRNY